MADVAQAGGTPGGAPGAGGGTVVEHPLQQQQQRLYDISKPKYDLETYGGRVAHFYSTTSPLTLLYSRASLMDAQRTVENYQRRIKEAGKRGVWVDEREKKEWEGAKQREPDRLGGEILFLGPPIAVG